MDSHALWTESQEASREIDEPTSAPGATAKPARAVRPVGSDPAPARRPAKRARASAGPPADAMNVYLRSVRRLPLLSSEQVADLAAEIAESEAAFRAAMYEIPGTAQLAVALWRERLDAGRVTGLLAHGYRDDAGRDWSAKIDRVMRRLEKRLALSARANARATAKAPAALLADAELQLDVLLGFLAEFRALSEAPRRTADDDARRRALGLSSAKGRAALRRAERATEARDRARQTFASHNLRLVIKLAKRFRGFGIPFADLIQEGNLGLMRAVEKFDHTRGFKFSTYAVWWIEQSMIRVIQNHSRTVRAPSHLYEQQRRYRRTEDELRQHLAREPERGELAAELGLDIAQLERLATTMRPLRSLDEPVGEDGPGTLGDAIADEAADADEPEAADRERMRLALARGLRSLDPRSRAILELRFGLQGEDELSLQEIGDRLGISRERVRQIQAKVFAKLAGRSDIAALGELPGAAPDEAA